MRILIYSINFSPELTGTGKCSGDMAEWFAERGHEVRAIVAPPHYPQWRIASCCANKWSISYPKRRDSVSLSNGSKKDNKCSLTIFRCPLWIPTKPSGLKRMLYLISFILSSFPIVLWQIFWRPHIVFVVEPSLAYAPQALLVAKLIRSKTWLHIQDYEIDAAFALGLMRGKLARSLFLSAELWLMRRFDRISAISERMTELAVTKGVDSKKVVLFKNWAIFDVCESNDTSLQSGETKLRPASACDYRSKLGLRQEVIVAMYSGNMGKKQGLELLSEVARILSYNHDIMFVFCGNGPGKVQLINECEALNNVLILDLQPQEYLREFLSMADIHLLPQSSDVEDLVMPSKLIGMLASGRPVVTTANKGTQLAMMGEICGLVVPPEQPKLFADAIVNLASNSILRRRLGLAGQIYASKLFDRDTILSTIEYELYNLTSTGKQLSL